MSQKHPIISVIGSSGAGTSTVKHTFEQIFRRENVTAISIEGDAFHKYDRESMKKELDKRTKSGDSTFSHFSFDANILAELESIFKTYGSNGTGRTRNYVHSEEESKLFGVAPGKFTEWREIEAESDLLFYEGLHGAVVNGDVNIAKYADLKIGVVPVTNLEWIQKIHRDKEHRGYSAEATVDTIHRRMWDYINYLTPQFSRTHINFQRVPTVDTSNPFIARDIPTQDESFVVVRFQDHKYCDFVYLQDMVVGSFMSRPNTLVVPGGKMGFVMELILREQVEKMLTH